MEEEVVGIELLKKFVKESIELGMEVNEQLKDGWQWKDAFSILAEGKDLTFVVTKWQSIVDEFQNLDEDEIIELVKQAVGDLGLTDEDLLEVVDQLIDFGQSAYHLFLAIKGLKK